jgi:hypothetical protein
MGKREWIIKWRRDMTNVRLFRLATCHSCVSMVKPWSLSLMFVIDPIISWSNSTSVLTIINLKSQRCALHIVELYKKTHIKEGGISEAQFLFTCKVSRCQILAFLLVSLLPIFLSVSSEVIFGFLFVFRRLFVFFSLKLKTLF